MAATDGQIVVAAARWAEEGHYMREFISKHRLPAVVKIIKGQYGGLGVPTLPNPGLQSTALLVSAGRRHKIVAQAVKMKEGRRIVGVGPRIAIPDTYQGYFELLSEEGRAVRCIESVLELARRRLEAGCLVREPIRGIVARLDSEGSITADGARTVALGETLFPSGEVQLGNSKGRYLRCLDSRGDTVLLSMDQRGRFSAIAKEDNISGVHTAKNLLSKRLPLTVRLVHGTPPRGLKSASQFVPELRLLSTYEEEHVFALPLQKDTGAVVALPLAAPIKLQLTRNEEQLRNLREFQRLVEKCGKLVADVADRAHVLDGKLGESKGLNHSIPSSKSGYFLRRSASSDSANYHSHFYSNENRVPSYTDEYDEIDQIYDYVRGIAPLPKSIMTSSFTNDTSRSCSPTSPASDDRTKPEPPPIETIPTKKHQNQVKAEKRTRKSSSKEPLNAQEKIPTNIYVKSGNTQRGRVLRQKSSSPLKEHPPTIIKAGSPLFNIRYKSLNNLQAMEMDGTLDSSHSGGRTSGDSGAGAKLPEKRSRRLSRPRSLTNLVWELRGGDVDRKKPPKLEAGVHRKGSGSHKLTFGGHKRIGTLYL
uniref:CABIT domain-containing protein n=2 Tax=Clastoptera arizonana TaxID=38151 RepID=A0A1B6DUN9_9HEMI